MILFSLLCSLVWYSLRTYAFSRQWREFNVSFDVQEGGRGDRPVTVTFDPSVESVVRTVTKMCGMVACPRDISTVVKLVTDQYHLKLRKEVAGAYSRYVGTLYVPQEPGVTREATWADQAAPGMSALYTDTIREARALFAGFLGFRSHCHLDADLAREGCDFARMLQNQIGLPDDPQNITVLARGMFNQKFWIQAEALAMYTLLGNLDMQHQQPEAADMNMLLTMLSEVSAARGQVKEAAYFSAASLEMTGDNLLRQSIGRLRAILAIPAITPDYAEAERFRAEIVHDLKAFGRSITAEHVYVDRYILSTFVAATPFHMAHQGLNDAPFQAALGEAIHALSPNVYYVAQRLRAGPPAPPRKTRPLRVGIVSAHLGYHSIGKMFIELFLQLTDRRDEFNVRPLAFLIDSQCAAPGCDGLRDPITLALDEKLGTDFQRLPHDVAMAEEEMERAELDVLLYADLGMEFTTYVLAHARLAPLQIAWWGHPITSGLPTIDHFFGLDVEVPWAANHYTEQHVRMEHMNSAPFVKSEEEVISTELLGLPPNARYICVLGRLFKFHPAFSRVMARILTAVPGAYVVVVAEVSFHTNQLLFERLQDTMEPESPGTVSRVRFANFKHYNHIMHQAVGVLDTFPYGGCLTTHDALSNSVPMVTLPLEHVRGRYSLGMYEQMQHLDLVAHNESHYVDLAVRLLTDDGFQKQQSAAIDLAYNTRYHRNDRVAEEWVEFFHRALS